MSELVTTESYSVLVTGGAGFIGSNFVRYLLKVRPKWRVINYDALTYAGNMSSLADVETDPRYHLVKTMKRLQ